MVLFTSGGSRCAVAGEIELPLTELRGPIVVEAATANHWQEGVYDVWLLRGPCRIAQGGSQARADEAVLWIEHNADGSGTTKIIAYLEGEVEILLADGAETARYTDRSWLGRLYSDDGVDVRVANAGGEPTVKPVVYEQAVARRDPYHRPAIERTQFTEFDADTPQVDPLPPGARRLRAFPRSSVPPSIRWFPSPGGNEWIAVVESGVNLIIDGLDEFGSVDILTDRMVIWTSGLQEADLTGQSLQSDETPLQIYLEGNIVFRQGQRVLYAERMFYDVRNEVGTVLAAEVLTPVPDYEGLLRLKADVLQQLSRDRFFAQNGYITSSRFGLPRYRLQARQIYFEDNQRPIFDPFTGATAVDPNTGEPLVESERRATATNNFLYLGPVPVFYWPRFATDVTDPTLFIERIAVKNDRIFGTQILVDLDAYELLGISNRPEGTQWDISLDYLSERGPAAGTAFTYNRADTFFGAPTNYAGLVDFWAIHDTDLDNLGAGRQAVPLDKEFRHRLLARHRQYFPGALRLTAEAGWISDRNFLEQYFENEWDEFKDQTTGIELKQLIDNSSWSITADTRLNDFFTQTEWLPRGDHFLLGQSLLGDWLTWYEHSQAGYGRLRTASAPTDPVQAPFFSTLPWEVTSAGERLVTRQEIDLPLLAGPVKVVPYALGEFAHWGEDLTGNDLQRLYGQAGVRASLPAWNVYPWVESALLNVHGVAHKAVLEVDASFADSNRDLTMLPLYDPLEDDNLEQFRRRFNIINFAGVVPPQFDERFYALRSGIGRWVSSPTTEVADDLTTVRLGFDQRWQTKRGLPGRRRIIDWVILETGAVVYPDANRDNFGEEIGLVDYNFRWHVGDKVTVLSDGLFDFFVDGQQLASVGVFLNRPPRGAVSLQFRVLEGPISSKAVIANYSYLMSPKWVSSIGTMYDFENDTNTHQLALTRIGESLLVSAGLTANSSKDVVGVNLAVEPRFLPGARIRGAGGAQIPPAGLFGLE